MEKLFGYNGIKGKRAYGQTYFWKNDSTINACTKNAINNYTLSTLGVDSIGPMVGNEKHTLYTNNMVELNKWYPNAHANGNTFLSIQQISQGSEFGIAFTRWLGHCILALS